MNRRITAILFMATLCSMLLGMKAQVAVEGDEKLEALGIITSGYDDWEALEISGKLYAEGLPVNPSLKIYMERDSALFISVRAPLVGEAFRLECTPGTLLVVNKMKKQYFEADPSVLLKDSPMTLGNLQNLLLGRLFIMGSDTLSEDMADEVSMFLAGEEDELWAVVPRTQPHELEVTYSFETFTDGAMAAFEIVSDRDTDGFFMDYYPGKKGTDITVTLTRSNTTKEMTAELSLDEPKTARKPYDPFVPTDKYTRMEPGDFLKSLFR